MQTPLDRPYDYQSSGTQTINKIFSAHARQEEIGMARQASGIRDRFAQ
jgi:hypothetical protein